MRYLNNRGRNQRLFVTFHGTGGNLYSLYFLTEELDAKAGVLSFLGDKGVGVNRRYFNPLVNQELDREDLALCQIGLMSFTKGMGRDRQLFAISALFVISIQLNHSS